MTARSRAAPRLPAGPASEPVSDVVAALQARGRFGVRLGLARTRALLAAVGSPEQGLRGALIGGTNGKGSTQAMVASILRAAGLRVGQTPKPHLVSYRERIVVDERAQTVTHTRIANINPGGLGDFVRRYEFPTEDRLILTPLERTDLRAVRLTWERQK